uniref:Complement component C8 beta chain n=1 Tax=Molossus molossus TaxID=27622 RepID=A0A7J8F6H5_MOLMO|nr:complement C8 beta chain [Molossus molossus]
MKTSRAWAWGPPAQLALLSAALACLGLPGSGGERPPSLESNAVNESLAKSRQTRGVDVTLMPINCELSSWSSWTRCDPCQKKRYRHAVLLRPSQFHGDPCNNPDKEAEDCVTNAPCRSQVRCEGFVCAQTGRCVNRRLLCNGDNDCGDQSDEANCRRIYKKCQQEMDQYWAIGNLASGVNLFTNSFEGPVLDHRYYGGACSPHFILNTRFRKPYNVESFTPQRSKFLHARSDLVVARYALKSRGRMLHHEFLQRLRRLPLEFGYAEYRDLFRDFGTHFVTEAVLGGVYEYTLVVDQEALEKSDFSLKDVHDCAKAGFRVGAAFKALYLRLGVSMEQCEAILKEMSDRKKKNSIIEDLVVRVRGGASEYVTALAYKDLPTADLMQEWGDAVQYNPDIIKIKAEPLYELVTSADVAYSSTVKQHMKRALEEFQKEVSSCLCAPCLGNGVPVLKGSRCDCICPNGFQGQGCEITLRKNVPTDGQWNCWSSWSPCSGGHKTRQRQCNNPPPQNGGSPCSGPASETRTC